MNKSLSGQVGPTSQDLTSGPRSARDGGSGQPASEPAAVDHGANRLLAALPVADLVWVIPRLTPVTLDLRQVLFDAGEPIQAVHFPLEGVVSLVTPLEDGDVVEVATIGNEGMVGLPLVSGGSLAVRAVSQVAGRALRMEVGAFREALDGDGAIGTVLRRYVLALFGQIAQASACNRLHTNEERLSRWLLMSQDRVGTDRFRITHELIAQALGVRRATVTLSMQVLQMAELIQYRRGEVTIVDREGLESTACECYRLIKRELHQVVGGGEP